MIFSNISQLEIISQQNRNKMFPRLVQTNVISIKVPLAARSLSEPEKKPRWPKDETAKEWDDQLIIWSCESYTKRVSDVTFDKNFSNRLSMMATSLAEISAMWSL